MSLDASTKREHSYKENTRIHVWAQSQLMEEGHTRVQHWLIAPKLPFYGFHHLCLAAGASKEDGPSKLQLEPYLNSLFKFILLTQTGLTEFIPAKHAPATLLTPG